MSEKVALMREPMPKITKLLNNDPFFERFQKMQDSIARRAFNLFKDAGFLPGHETENWLKAESEIFQPAPILVTENNEEVILKAEVPGFTENEIEVRVDPRRIFISGKHEQIEKEKMGKTVYSEWKSNEILREFDLPTQVNPDEVKAELHNGVLTVMMMKVAKPKAIAVTAKSA